VFTSLNEEDYKRPPAPPAVFDNRERIAKYEHKLAKDNGPNIQNWINDHPIKHTDMTRKLKDTICYPGDDLLYKQLVFVREGGDIRDLDKKADMINVDDMLVAKNTDVNWSSLKIEDWSGIVP
jgi:hypothetical protein